MRKRCVCEREKKRVGDEKIPLGMKYCGGLRSRTHTHNISKQQYKGTSDVEF